jgi:hypothetical protein
MSGESSISEPALDRLLDDARIAVAQLGNDAAPDFAELLARVHARAPELVPAEAVRDVALTERVVDIRSTARGAPEREAALDGLFADAREAIVRKVDARRMAAIPALRRPLRGRRAAAIAVAASLAAAIALAFASLDLVQEATPAGEGEHVDQALHMGGHHGADDGGFESAEEPVHGVVHPVEETTPAPSSEAPSSEPRPEPKRPRASQRGEQLRTLSDEAQALWRAGDVRGAEKVLERIVAIGGRSVQAEMAFADLFVIAHQLHGASGRKTRWAAYVRRFPHGRFADDARAGLCREAADGNRASCWRDYLRSFSSGSYRAEAARALESE